MEFLKAELEVVRLTSKDDVITASGNSGPIVLPDL